MTMPFSVQVLATVLFACAVLHTFSVSVFAGLSAKQGTHSGFWHLMAEVEVVFGFWAFLLIVLMAFMADPVTAIDFVDTRNYTEPLFVFAIMVVAASRPILELVGGLVRGLARALPLCRHLSTFFIVLGIVPLLGSLITEPAAMTLAALLLRDAYFKRPGHELFKYMTLGVLFVNISIGGVLTAYAAPPVLMVASAFGWDSAFMFSHFGWRAVIAVLLNAFLLTFVFRKALKKGEVETHHGVTEDVPVTVPLPMVLVHVGFLVAIVLTAHHPAVFMGLLVLFLGFCSAYPRYQSRLMIKEGLLVGFFLAGLVILGSLQKWWLQDLLGGLSPIVLFWGSMALTALTDNAALTFLGSLVEGSSQTWRYMLVAGAVTGGGLTVIANAPNPAGYAILKGSFKNEAISAIPLLLAAICPTTVAAVLFLV